MAQNHSTRPGNDPIFSEFADDADMAELIEMFVDEMPERVSQLESCWEQSDGEAIKRLAHQLKGASGGYGFSVVGQAAATLEDAIKEQLSGDQADALSSLQQQFDELVNLCQKVSVK